MEIGRPKPVAVSVQYAIERFEAECIATNLRVASIKKYRQVLTSLSHYCKTRSVAEIRHVNVGQLRELRETWQGRRIKTKDGAVTRVNISPVSVGKKTQLLRSFFRFCQDSGWINDNPAKKLRQPIIDAPQTIPFSEEEFKKILAATYQYKDSWGRTD